LLSFVMFVPLTVIPTFLAVRRNLSPHLSDEVNYGFSASATVIGLCFLPGFLVSLAGGPLSGIVGRRFGTRVPAIAGMTFVTAGSLVLATMHTHLWQVLVGASLVGMGQVITSSACATMLMSAVPDSQTGVASAMNQIVRIIGAVIATAGGAAILSASLVPGSQVPALDGFISIFWVTTAVAAIGLVISTLVNPRVGKVEKEPVMRVLALE
jgi:MFS family permease